MQQQQTPRQFHARQLGGVGGIDGRTVLIVAAVALVLGGFGTGLGLYATVKVTGQAR